MIGVLIALVVGIGAFPVPVSQVPDSPVLNVSRFTLPGLAAAIPVGGVDALYAQPVPLTLLSGQTSLDAVVSANNNTDETRRAITAAQALASAPQASVESESSGRIPIFLEYEVQSGDTLGAIASRFGVSVNYIVWNNVDVHNANDISPGQLLQIPSVEGIIHSVRVDETVTQIATLYDADWRDIVEFRANNLSGDPNNIQPGSLILVPGGRVVPLVVAPPERPGASVNPGAGLGGWVWPAQGMLSSPFSPSHPLGIDVAAPVGTPVTAAGNGLVSFAGGNPCCSYGYHIIIDHGDGYETLYAHLGSFAVSGGEWVNAGQVIGYLGLTGRTTGPHVHFELRRNGVYQDPLNYLP